MTVNNLSLLNFCNGLAILGNFLWAKPKSKLGHMTAHQNKSRNELVNEAQIIKPMTAFSFFRPDLGLKIEFFI